MDIRQFWYKPIDQHENFFVPIPFCYSKVYILLESMFSNNERIPNEMKAMNLLFQEHMAKIDAAPSEMTKSMSISNDV